MSRYYGDVKSAFRDYIEEIKVRHERMGYIRNDPDAASYVVESQIEIPQTEVYCAELRNAYSRDVSTEKGVICLIVSSTVDPPSWIHTIAMATYERGNSGKPEFRRDARYSNRDGWLNITSRFTDSTWLGESHIDPKPLPNGELLQCDLPDAELFVRMTDDGRFKRCPTPPPLYVFLPGLMALIDQTRGN